MTGSMPLHMLYILLLQLLWTPDSPDFLPPTGRKTEYSKVKSQQSQELNAHFKVCTIYNLLMAGRLNKSIINLNINIYGSVVNKVNSIKVL